MIFGGAAISVGIWVAISSHIFPFIRVGHVRRINFPVRNGNAPPIEDVRRQRHDPHPAVWAGAWMHLQYFNIERIAAIYAGDRIHGIDDHLAAVLGTRRINIPVKKSANMHLPGINVAIVGDIQGNP